MKRLQLSIHLYQTLLQELKPAIVNGMAKIYVLPILTLLTSVFDRLRKLRKLVSPRAERFTG